MGTISGCRHLKVSLKAKITYSMLTALMVYSGAWGKLIHEKNQKSKISWHCPFKLVFCFFSLFLKVNSLVATPLVANIFKFLRDVWIRTQSAPQWQLLQISYQLIHPVSGLPPIYLVTIATHLFRQPLATHLYWKPSISIGSHPSLLEAIQLYWKPSISIGSHTSLLEAIHLYWKPSISIVATHHYWKPSISIGSHPSLLVWPPISVGSHPLSKLPPISLLRATHSSYIEKAHF